MAGIACIRLAEDPGRQDPSVDGRGSNEFPPLSEQLLTIDGLCGKGKSHLFREVSSERLSTLHMQ